MDRLASIPTTAAMAPIPRWADLVPELLSLIVDRLDLKGYARARGACTAWRRALAPLSPMLLVVADDADDPRWCRPYAASLATRRSFELAAIAWGSRCVGSSNGWLALSVDDVRHRQTFVTLLNPVAAVEFLLPPLTYEGKWVPGVSKVVFSPSPAKDDFAAAAICDVDRVAYVTAGAKRWAVTDPVRLTSGDHLADVVYTDDEEGNKVYCLTTCGDVHVLRLPDRRRRNPANVDDEAAELSLLRPPQPDERTMNLHPLLWQRQQRNFQMMHARTIDEDFPTVDLTFIPHFKKVAPKKVEPEPESQEPPHGPATVEPLLSEANLPFNPATAFAPPYDIVSLFTIAKNLVFCEGNLYQVWRNGSYTVTLNLPRGGGRRRVEENEILVLRYYPQRQQQPCWDVVKDLGGHSLFVGRNNAVSMYAEGVPGLRGNCVYWIGGRAKDEGMVFDMESGRSMPCWAAPPVGFLPRRPHSTICWYFFSDVMKNI